MWFYAQSRHVQLDVVILNGLIQLVLLVTTKVASCISKDCITYTISMKLVFPHANWFASISTHGSRGGGGGWQGVQTPMKNHKNIGFLSNTGPDPLKNHKATKSVFNVGPSSAHQRKRHLNGVSLVDR